MQTTFARSLRWPYRGSFRTSNTKPPTSKTTVAIFHLSVKTVSRSAGRSATAAAAYRAGVEITDERTGEIHDYQRKAGVESAELFLPAGAPEWATDRAKLWNAAEQSEKRKNSTVAREFEVALPSELSADQRRELAHDFARELVKRHGFAVDVAIHAPGKDGDSKNHHAHILCTTRKLTAEGFTEKTRELDDRATGAAEVTHWRERWAGLTNAALERAGHAERVDHRTLEAQGIDREAGIHLGPTATAIERRGEVSEKTQHHQERQQEAAGKVAAMVAIAEAQAKAAEQAAQAQAQREAAQQQAEQARAQAQAVQDLATATLAKQEKEDESIRAAAFDRIGNNVRATSQTWGSTVDTIEASRGHLNSGGRVAHGYGPNLGRAIQGAGRRELGKHLEGCAGAVANQLGRIDKVLQQASRLFTGVVGTLAAVAKEVAKQFIERVAKAPERPQQAAQVQVKVITTPTPEKPLQHPEIDRIKFHTEADKELAERTKAPRGEAQRQKLGIDIQTAIREAVATSRATEPKTNVGSIERDTKAEHNIEANRAGKMEPWPQGQSNCALLIPATNAKRELEAHLEAGRPLMFGRDKFDDKTAALTRQHKTIENAAKAAETRLSRDVAQRIAAARQQDTQNAPRHAQAELRIGSLKALEKIAERERGVARSLEMQKPEHTRTRDLDRGMGR